MGFFMANLGSFAHTASLSPYLTPASHLKLYPQSKSQYPPQVCPLKPELQLPALARISSSLLRLGLRRPPRWLLFCLSAAKLFLGSPLSLSCSPLSWLISLLVKGLPRARALSLLHHSLSRAQAPSFFGLTQFCEDFSCSSIIQDLPPEFRRYSFCENYFTCRRNFYISVGESELWILLFHHLELLPTSSWQYSITELCSGYMGVQSETNPPAVPFCSPYFFMLHTKIIKV